MSKNSRIRKLGGFKSNLSSVLATALPTAKQGSVGNSHITSAGISSLPGEAPFLKVVLVCKISHAVIGDATMPSFRLACFTSSKMCNLSCCVSALFRGSEYSSQQY